MSRKIRPVRFRNFFSDWILIPRLCPLMPKFYCRNLFFDRIISSIRSLVLKIKIFENWNKIPVSSKIMSNFLYIRLSLVNNNNKVGIQNKNFLLNLDIFDYVKNMVFGLSWMHTCYHYAFSGKNVVIKEFWDIDIFDFITCFFGSNWSNVRLNILNLFQNVCIQLNLHKNFQETLN